MGSINVRMRVANYQETWKRNACNNCAHLHREVDGQDIGKATLSCTKHHFYVQRMAVCDDWEAPK